ncbi:prolyl-tRNA editing enzyme YbaK/EbsC (Cys-tRNA(Pro) deacylase) [Streptosporangium album]|uniref:Prolyl-tRNA editing enzyme YbaK/EbsC (Cys-tRNA(Pro) deacylase) n=1 Tax=Streptosporangium album TaxID=47479 RepID=A0A7W7RS35_9ACTN|nr:YbaK/EbsC family protein [Streptosporangium album]MBB4937164.1 prolyl-tRNA editing enzyme YbaK/EbsC (Cys-tRNA(Pro) deacylase) [Streptosporangium album]
MAIGTLDWVGAATRLDLLAEPVARAVAGLDGVEVAEIDPTLADTAAFCERYGVSLGESANCVIVAAKRGGEVRHAACVVLATTRADVNGVVRRRLDARKISFAPQEEAVGLTGMEYGGITPLGLPEGWPVLVDEAVAAHPEVVIGSGVRHSKLAIPGAVLAGLKTAEVLRLAN